MSARATRIAILDSGVHLDHPHVGGITGGIGIGPDSTSADYQDTLGHGTAVAALIHALHPAAQLLCVKIFDRRLATSIAVVLRAIDWCLEHDVDIINLSLGTSNQDHKPMFEAAVERAAEAGAVIVSAYESEGAPVLPGSLPGVIGVVADPDCPWGTYRVGHRSAAKVLAAPPYPREIPGVPRERNLQGVSFSVAHVSALLARRRDDCPAEGDHESLTSLALPAGMQRRRS